MMSGISRERTVTVVNHSSQACFSFAHIDECDRLLVIGTTLATYSAFRYTQ